MHGPEFGFFRVDLVNNVGKREREDLNLLVHHHPNSPHHFFYLMYVQYLPIWLDKIK